MPLLIPTSVYHRIVFFTVLRPTLAAAFSIFDFAVTQGPVVAQNIFWQSIAYYGTASTLTTIPPLIPVIANNSVIQQYAALSPENGLTAGLVFISFCESHAKCYRCKWKSFNSVCVFISSWVSKMISYWYRSSNFNGSNHCCVCWCWEYCYLYKSCSSSRYLLCKRFTRSKKKRCQILS